MGTRNISLKEYFNTVFKLSNNIYYAYSYKVISFGVFISINSSGLFLDIVKPVTTDITKRYTPTKQRIDALAALYDILQW